MKVPIKGFALAALVPFGLAAQQLPATPAIHAKAAHRLVIKNAMVIYGNAKPPYGPVDIVVQDGLISYIGPADAAPSASGAIPTTPRSSDTVIDATGKYVMPGMTYLPVASMTASDDRGVVGMVTDELGMVSAGPMYEINPSCTTMSTGP